MSSVLYVGHANGLTLAIARLTKHLSACLVNKVFTEVKSKPVAYAAAKIPPIEHPAMASILSSDCSYR